MHRGAHRRLCGGRPFQLKVPEHPISTKYASTPTPLNSEQLLLDFVVKVFPRFSLSLENNFL